MWMDGGYLGSSNVTLTVLFTLLSLLGQVYGWFISIFDIFCHQALFL